MYADDLANLTQGSLRATLRHLAPIVRPSRLASNDAVPAHYRREKALPFPSEPYNNRRDDMGK